MQDDQRDVRIGLELSGLEQNEGGRHPEHPMPPAN